MNPFGPFGFELLADSYVQLAFLLGGLFLLMRMGKAVPSRRAFALILLPALLMLLGFFWPPLERLFQIYNPLLMLMLMVDAFLLSPRPQAVGIARILPQPCQIGIENPVALRVAYSGKLPVHLELRDDVPPALIRHRPETVQSQRLSLQPGETATLHYSVLPEDRGTFEFGYVHARYPSRLKLLWLTVQGGEPQVLTVAPNLRRVRQMRIRYSRSLVQGELQKRSLGLEGTRFSGLRNYFHGDDLRKVAWQSTAKLDVPVVRTFEPEVEQPILILLDAGRKMLGRTGTPEAPASLQKFDWALNAALGFMAVALDRGDCVGFGAFSNRILAHVPPRAGAAHFRHVQEVMAGLRAEAAEPQYEAALLQFARTLKRRTLVVLLTDLIDPAASRALLKGLKAFSANHMLMVVTLADQNLASLSERLPLNSFDAYERGVAMDLLALRRQTLGELNRGRRSTVIEAAPHELDEALIGRYLSIKRKSQL